jgi:uncharacterized membrane protein
MDGLAVFFGLIALLIGGCVLILPIVAFVRTLRITEIEHRLARIESILARQRVEARPAEPVIEDAIRVDEEPPPERPRPRPHRPPSRPAPVPPDSAAIESWLGQKFMGWAAVVLLLFATAFFLKYAFDNNWIGPLGRVSIGVLAGSVLCAGGFAMFRRGRWLACQMLTAAGIVLLYLCTFAAFGYYRLLPREHAGVYFVLIVVEAALLAGLYEAESIAVMAVVGALLSPILLRSEVDQYRSLFTYLAVLDLGFVALALWRRWRIVAPLALVGTQGLFWMWWAERYHPAKFGAVMSFQLVLFVLFLFHDLVAPALRRVRAHPVQLLGIVVNCLFLCLVTNAVMEGDDRLWLPALALSLGAVLAALVYAVQRRSPGDAPLQLVPLAVAASLIAAAVGLRAEAGWVAMGWAVEGAALWWVGLRLRVVPIRAFAAAFLVLAAGRFFFVDTPDAWRREIFYPLFNDYAAPGLVVAACLLVVCRLTRHALPQGHDFDRVAYWACGLGGVLFAWFVLSVDTHQYLHRYFGGSAEGDRYASTGLSVLWAVYSGVVLYFGFRLESRPVRLTAQGLFGLTLAKVVLVDMSQLSEFFRVVAFFVLALVMGLGAYAYQRHFARERAR